MPELPEVETVARTLSPYLAGERIQAVRVHHPPSIATPDPETFARVLTGDTVLAVTRRAKYLILPLVSGRTLGAHLRMTGQFRLTPGGHTRAELQTPSHTLYFNDPRTFGRLYLWEGEPQLPPLGPEPLSEAFSIAYLGGELAKRQAALKGVLLDQKVVAGLGNIYADEVLFRSRLSPFLPASCATPAEIERLHHVIRTVLADAIERCGTTFRDYRDVYGEVGTYQNQLGVYGRAGQACPECGGEIQKTVLAQRGTHFCPSCQPALRS